MPPVDLTGQIYVRDRRPQFTGSYSYVYRGIFNKTTVAIKVIKAASDTSLTTMRRKVNREREVWAALNHPNILPFYGFADDDAFGPFGALISPWCKYGDANGFFSEYGNRVPTSQRIDLWKDAIAGVDYLHSYNPTLIHGDIKPGNVLIDDSVRAVLSDFGLVRIILAEIFDKGSSTIIDATSHTGTERYLAPELVSGDDFVLPTAASDIYALGCLGLEFVFSQKVYAHRKHNLRGCLIDDIASGMPPAEMPEEINVNTLTPWDVIQSCWKAVPSERPSALRLLERLNESNVATEIRASNSSPGVLHEKNQSPGSNSTLGAHASIGSTSQSVLREGLVKVIPITEEKSDEIRRFESLRIPDEDGPPSEAAMAKDNPPAPQMTSYMSELPERDTSYSLDDTMRPPAAATLLISTIQHTATSEIEAFNSYPDALHEQNQSLGPNSTVGAHPSVGSTTRAHSFDSNSVLVSSAQKTDAEETADLHDPNNGISLAEGDDLSATLEKLMIDYVPCDLSSQVVIPDRGSPAQGGLADVHFGWFDKREVAVKVLRIRKRRRADPYWETSNERRITREMLVWSALKHRNICEFLGYSKDFSDYPAMISTWCHRGTAYDYLESQELSVRERIRLALDVSEGLSYLHELKIVHGDLKPTNVLVDNACVGRLCDFGLVRLVDWEGPAGMTTTSPYTGTERYKAPELFISRDNRRPVATFEGDMYSLGCVMLEFIERLYPFERFSRAADLRDAIMDGHSPALRSETTRSLLNMTDFFWELLDTCWADPSSRPSIKEVVDALQGFARAMPPTS